jgi:hypothetical protein
MWKVCFIYSLFFFSSCIPRIYRSDFEDRPFKINQPDIKELRIDGAYYQIDHHKSLFVYFFYKNCIERYIGADSSHYNRSAIAQSIQEIIDDFNTSKKDTYSFFADGGYSIINDQISVQHIRYIPQFAWGTVTRKGIVVNDSTIMFTEYRFPKRGIFENDSNYYHFVKTNKPDSLKANRWKNKRWYWR